mmetsp:Transcript_11362/g.43919  ORF Transcript_11362/g.43919 Transcript_11362/m.43919 type:complete len:288 (-) Transcript_11362:416-1279(-)
MSRPCSPPPPRSARSRRRTTTPPCSRGSSSAPGWTSCPSAHSSWPASEAIPTRCAGPWTSLACPPWTTTGRRRAAGPSSPTASGSARCRSSLAPAASQFPAGMCACSGLRQWTRVPMARASSASTPQPTPSRARPRPHPTPQRRPPTRPCRPTPWSLRRLTTSSAPSCSACRCRPALSPACSTARSACGPATSTTTPATSPPGTPPCGTRTATSTSWRAWTTCSTWRATASAPAASRPPSPLPTALQSPPSSAQRTSSRARSPSHWLSSRPTATSPASKWPSRWSGP